MPYVLKHKATGEIFACTLKNIYDFDYHGVKAWDSAAAASAELGPLTAEHGYDEPWLWEVTALDESKLKLCNVKLNNNPSRRVLMLADGRLDVQSAP
jgi:hypothetical protein